MGDNISLSLVNDILSFMNDAQLVCSKKQCMPFFATFSNHSHIPHVAEPIRCVYQLKWPNNFAKLSTLIHFTTSEESMWHPYAVCEFQVWGRSFSP